MKNTIKIGYYTPYTNGKINGYVIAKRYYKFNFETKQLEDTNKFYITERQLKRAFDKLTLGGVKPQFALSKEIDTLYLVDKEGFLGQPIDVFMN